MTDDYLTSKACVLVHGNLNGKSEGASGGRDGKATDRIQAQVREEEFEQTCKTERWNL